MMAAQSVGGPSDEWRARRKRRQSRKDHRFAAFVSPRLPLPCPPGARATPDLAQVRSEGPVAGAG